MSIPHVLELILWPVFFVNVGLLYSNWKLLKSLRRDKRELNELRIRFHLALADQHLNDILEMANGRTQTEESTSTLH